jgi:two-component system sensor histidine kinase QseC
VTLQKRLLLYLGLAAPLVWALALVISLQRARHEVDELFDTEMVRLTLQVQATLVASRGLGSGNAPLPMPLQGDSGEADLRYLAIAVWDQQGRLVLADREGVQLPRRPDASGFSVLRLGESEWRVYYLQSAHGEWLVAAGQDLHERSEVAFNLSFSQLAPWVAVLPVLLAAMVFAVRRALQPVRALSHELDHRAADDFQPLATARVPGELQPLAAAINRLLGRIETLLGRERRFTADAAHELRTPLAVLRAQWDVLRRAGSAAERSRAEASLDAGLQRMDRLVTQLLTLSRAEAAALPAQSQPVRWAALVEDVFSDCLPLAERRRCELACEWPAQGEPLPLQGDAGLLAVMLRNLVDNALRYAPEGSVVTLRFGPDALVVHNPGPPLPPEQLQRLGERFHRPEGQAEGGSGLGISIVQRIAALHGLQFEAGAGDEGQGVRITLRRGGTPGR